MRVFKSFVTTVFVSCVGMLVLAPSGADAAPEEVPDGALQGPATSGPSDLAAGGCSDKALKHYCAYRSRCRVKAQGKGNACYRLDDFVVKWGKHGAAKQDRCDVVRAKIKAKCFD